MSEHTPGPWEVLGRNGRGDIWVGPSRKTHPPLLENGVGIVTIREIMGQLAPEEVVANARLIAAAPDLLDVLQQYTANDDALEAGLPFDTYTKEYNRIYALAKAAIAKATGGAL